MKRFSLLIVPLLILFGTACSHSRYVRPLDKGELAVTGSFGGSMIAFSGAVIPVPLTSLSAGYGVHEKVTAFAGIHTTSALFQTFQMDMGATYSPFKPNKFIPGFSISPSLNIAADGRQGGLKVWPILDVNAYWITRKEKTSLSEIPETDPILERPSSYVYLGMNNFFELGSTAALGEKVNNRWLGSLQVGHVTAWKKWDLITEIKWIGFHKNSFYLVPDYIGLGKLGSMGLYLGVTRRIGVRP